MTSQRVHRTKAEWDALQAEQAKAKPPEVQGVAGLTPEGTVTVAIDGIFWQAPRILDLEAQALQVEVRYFRRWGWYRKGWWSTAGKNKKTEISIHMGPRHRGGWTHVRVLDPSTHRYSEGISYCTAQDSFDKRKGYVLAVNRALQELQR